MLTATWPGGDGADISINNTVVQPAQPTTAVPPSPEEQAQRFLTLVQANGYWLASPEENAAVGLEVNWRGPR